MWETIHNILKCVRTAYLKYCSPSYYLFEEEAHANVELLTNFNCIHQYS
jgi:hypothetical protein